jgi:ankyrin repeat protein
LFVSAQIGNVEVARVLVEAGTDIDQALTDGTTPFLVSAQYGHVEVVRALVKAGANIDQALPMDRRTPLYEAAIEGMWRW